MTVFLYLRLSTDVQDTANQKNGSAEFCRANGYVPDQCVEDTASGRVRWRERGIGKLTDAIPVTKALDAQPELPRNSM